MNAEDFKQRLEDARENITTQIEEWLEDVVFPYALQTDSQEGVEVGIPKFEGITNKGLVNVLEDKKFKVHLTASTIWIFWKD